MKFYVYVGLATVVLLSLWSCAIGTSDIPPKAANDHFIVIGVDGLSPNGLQKAITPTIDQMIAEGAASLQARSVLPSSSSPNWASMIMGAGPEQHGITSNGWQIDEHVLPPSVVTSAERFPSIFTLFKAQMPQANVGAVYDWDGFGRLFDKGEVDFDFNGENELTTVLAAKEMLVSQKPQFTFIHLDHVDHAGHTYGHGSDAYYAAVTRADSLIKAVIETTKEIGMFDRTTFLIASDHGGVGNGHGGESLAEMQIPFILYGHQIKKGYTINTPINQFDQAATVAYAFGLETPYAWIGKPVKHAFIGNQSPKVNFNSKSVAAAPQFTPNERIYPPQGGGFQQDSIRVTITSTSEGELRYALNESLLSYESSSPFTSTILLQSDALILSGIFKDKQLISEVGRSNYFFKDTNDINVKVRGYYQEELQKFPNVEELNPDFSMNTTHFELGDWFERLSSKEHVAVLFEGVIDITEEGSYTFYLNSDDGSLLYLDGQLLVDNDGDHGVIEKFNTIVLKPGLHDLKVQYFNGGGGYHLDLSVKGIDGIKRLIAPSMLSSRIP